MVRCLCVEPSWNLTSRPPRTTPEPTWAETLKLSAVGGKKKKHKVGVCVCAGVVLMVSILGRLEGETKRNTINYLGSLF